jgi:hypothetical protein
MRIKHESYKLGNYVTSISDRKLRPRYRTARILRRGGEKRKRRDEEERMDREGENGREGWKE